MKKNMLQKLLATTASLLSCALLIGNLIPLPNPPQGDGDSIVIEFPLPGNTDHQPDIIPLGDDEPWGGSGD